MVDPQCYKQHDKHNELYCIVSVTCLYRFEFVTSKRYRQSKLVGLVRGIKTLPICRSIPIKLTILLDTVANYEAIKRIMFPAHYVTL
jgi:hypothetical protein